MSSIIHKERLFDEILIKPAGGCDTLCIVSGFATPSMVAHHLEAVKNTFNSENTRIKLIIGMTPNGISKLHHENFIKLVNDKNGLFECSYINSNSFSIHTKLYTWLKNDKPMQAFLATANYTLTGFKRSQDEVACMCNPNEAYDYYSSKIDNSIYCTCDEANSMTVEPLRQQRHNIRQSENIDDESDIDTINSVKLPLFSERDNRVQVHGGLNWGQRGGREPNQAYILIPSKIARSGFFPPKGEQFSVLTEDGFPFICVVEQQGDKAIHTPNNNSELGEYFRNKLGVPLGAPVTLDDLDRYGNRYVTFTKIDEEEYYMEYSPNVME